MFDNASIFSNMQVLSIACCVFYSHCGNRAILRQKSSERKNSSWFSFSLWNKEERNTWLSKFLHMHELKDQVCSSWFAPVGSASDYPLLSKWVFYGEVEVHKWISISLSNLYFDQTIYFFFDFNLLFFWGSSSFYY